MEDLKDLFIDKKIMIDERNGVNVDFLIKDLVAIYDNPSIYVWNESSDHLREICRNKNLVIKSYYNGDIYNEELISDNNYIANKLYNTPIYSPFSIYRDSTGTIKDWYNYDLIILVELLPSGICVEYDGMITIKSREKIYKKMKYKIKMSKTEYYSF